LVYGSSHAKQPINTQTIENEDCKLIISSVFSSEELLIMLECKTNGNVKFEFVDFMGNTVIKREYDKKNYLLRLSFNQKLQSGVYFIRVTIDNSQVLFDKINIVR